MDIYGFISNAYGKNHYKVDKPLLDILSLYAGNIPELDELGDFAGREIYEMADYIDKIANPIHIMWSIDGTRLDKVWVAPSYKSILQKLFTYYGILKYPYHENSWHKHYASLYLIADPGIACILTVTNQTAYAIFKYGHDNVKDYFPKLIGDSEEILYGATWFTEIQGGSDLGANVTEAYKEGDIWRINGDKKYFASNAGIADLALVSARPQGAVKGAKGLALLLVPREYNGRMNFTVRRLKWKSGTVAVPTGEVEFNESMAYLLGDVDKGIYYIMENLMVARLANSVGALGISRKAFLESYYYTQIREAFGKKLIEHPLIKRDLMEMELLIEGGLALTFKAIDLFEKSWHNKPPYNEDYHYARLLIHICKNYTAEIASYVTKLAMEIHGGLGFLREYPIERLHREALITPLWEGTSNIHALEMLETFAKKRAHETLLLDIGRLVERMPDEEIADKAYGILKDKLSMTNSADIENIEFNSKDLLLDLAHILSSVLLSQLSHELGKERYSIMSKIYFERFVMKKPYSTFAIDNADKIYDIEDA
jgi:alkylation response protein AidB-like acyl-CoA dehydrogenase